MGIYSSQHRELCPQSTLLECASVSRSTQHGDEAILHFLKKEKKRSLLRGQSLLCLKFSQLTSAVYSVSISLR